LLKGIIDRFEGEYAIVEIEGITKLIKRCAISSDSREGDVIMFSQGKWIIDREATEELAREVRKLTDKLWE
jgi:hydrogenase maturation factor